MSHLLAGGQPGRNMAGKPKPPEGDEMVQDPQCKVYFPISRAVTKTVAGRAVHFCSEDCAEKYVKEIGHL